MNSEIQTDIEARLAGTRPDVEVLLVEPAGSGALRVTIDHPEGVTLGLCEEVTGDLAELRERYSLEISSPGSRRPLTRPAHFQRFSGRRARLKVEDSQGEHRSVSGEITGATGSEVTIAGPEGVVSIPYDEIVRANLMED